MNKDNTIKDKSFKFAVRIVHLYQYLYKTKKEFTLSKQLLRSGASVGALIREAEHAESKLDFKHKMSIAQKEINETLYSLELLEETDFLNKDQFNSINNDAVKIIKRLTSIIKSTKSSLDLTTNH